MGCARVSSGLVECEGRKPAKGQRDLIKKCRCVMVACFDRNSVYSKENDAAFVNLDFSELIRSARETPRLR